MRMLPTKDIPKEIWQKRMLHLPKSLQKTYKLLLQKYDRWDMALSSIDPSKNPIGGISEAETLEHFARRFGVSSSRLNGLVIDPDSAFSDIPDDIISSFSEGRITILDLACGTGAVGLSILSTVSVLRSHNKLPKLPLDVRILGGDCSALALDIYMQMIHNLDPIFKAEGINVSLETHCWQAEDTYNTSKMLDILFDSGSICQEFIIIVANFAGSLSQQFENFKDSMSYIFTRSGNKPCTIIWVESQVSKAHRIFKLIKNLLNRYSPWFNSSQVKPLSYEYDWFHPFILTRMDCRILVKEYKRHLLYE